MDTVWTIPEERAPAPEAPAREDRDQAAATTVQADGPVAAVPGPDEGRAGAPRVADRPLSRRRGSSKGYRELTITRSKGRCGWRGGKAP
jgi:hypothetical protein